LPTDSKVSPNTHTQIRKAHAYNYMSIYLLLYGCTKIWRFYEPQAIKQMLYQ